MDIAMWGNAAPWMTDTTDPMDAFGRLPVWLGNKKNTVPMDLQNTH